MPNNFHPIQSTDPELEPDQNMAGAEIDLGRAVAGGFAWLLAATVLGKIISLICNVMISWYIVPEDGDLVALALMVVTFVNLFREWGIFQVLMARQKRFALWAPIAFWMTMTLGIVSLLIMVGAAPLTAWIMREPKLIAMILFLALLQPIQTAWAIPFIKLRLDLRFRLLAIISAILGTAKSLLILGFAYLGFHAYSFIFPIAVLALAQVAIGWGLAPVQVGFKPQFRRWKYLATDSAVVGVGFVFVTIVSQGDYCLLKLFHGKGVVGIYWYGFLLSMQVLVLLTVNLGSVLFPAMTKIQNDPVRLHGAYLRATRMLMAFGAPACLLQAALAAPLIHLFFSAQWFGSIPVVQLLSIAMAVKLLDVPTVNMMQAEGRFRLYLLNCVIGLIAFLAFGLAAAILFSDAHAATAMAAAIVLTYLVWEPTQMYLAIRNDGQALRKTAATLLKPIILPGLWIALLDWLAQRAVGSNLYFQSAFILVLGAAGSMLIIRLLMPAAWYELVNRIKPYLGRNVSG